MCVCVCERDDSLEAYKTIKKPFLRIKIAFKQLFRLKTFIFNFHPP